MEERAARDYEAMVTLARSRNIRIAFVTYPIQFPDVHRGQLGHPNRPMHREIARDLLGHVVDDSHRTPGR
jgi:hypothetical protein